MGSDDIEVETIISYPNPSTGAISFKGLEQGGIYSYDVYSISGKNVVHGIMNGSTGMIALDIKSGLYVVRLHDESNSKELVSKVLVY